MGDPALKGDPDWRLDVLASTSYAPEARLHSSIVRQELEVQLDFCLGFGVGCGVFEEAGAFIVEPSDVLFFLRAGCACSIFRNESSASRTFPFRDPKAPLGYH